MVKHPRTHTVDSHLQIQYRGSMVRYISDDWDRLADEKRIVDLHYKTSQTMKFDHGDFEFHFYGS